MNQLDNKLDGQRSSFFFFYNLNQTLLKNKHFSFVLTILQSWYCIYLIYTNAKYAKKFSIFFTIRRFVRHASSNADNLSRICSKSSLQLACSLINYLFAQLVIKFALEFV